MASDKSLAAEIEATTERERTRLIAWLAEHQVSTGTTIDREMTADALMADFIAPRLAEIAALQSRAFEDGARWMRDEALAAARPWMVVVTPDPTSKTPRSHKAISSGLYEAITALPLQPEGERNV